MDLVLLLRVTGNTVKDAQECHRAQQSQS